jgi:hypothetical protein
VCVYDIMMIDDNDGLYMYQYLLWFNVRVLAYVHTP